MNEKLLLARCITLLYQESRLDDKIENSSELIRTILDTIQVSDVSIGLNTDREVIIALKSTILDMCNNPNDHKYNKTELLQTIKVNTFNNEKLYEAISQGIEEDLHDGQLKRFITNTRKSINGYFREQEIGRVLNNASTMFRFKRDKIKDVNQFLSEIQAQLEPLQMNIGNKDPAVISDVDIGNDESMRAVFTDLHEASEGTGYYKTGLTAVDRMLQGGFRPSKTTMIAALQHKYKTGFTLTLFEGIALNNKPLNKDPSKKPLLLRISFEDAVEENLQFLYQSLKYNETREPVSIKGISVEELSSYVKNKLQVNGFHVRMLRVDPSRWNYKNLCNKVLEFEAQGYVVEVLMVDYLALLPTTGCITSGPTGTDLRDLFRRLRNFTAAKKIAFITPHQLSTEAKQLIRGGIPEDKFVKEINEKGYYAGCKQLDQEVDCEIYIHLFKHNKDTYLSVQRGKHRIPTILDEDDKYFLYKFPKYGMPIPLDIEGEDHSIPKLSMSVSNTNDELFQLG